MPSLASVVRAVSASVRASISIWVSSVSVQPPWKRRLAAPKASVGPAASRAAKFEAASVSSGSATTPLIKPQSCASRAESERPISANSRARRIPNKRGRK